jgi:MoCo/4Fe-4S cofactor protein with predicted Tat translocation signal
MTDPRRSSLDFAALRRRLAERRGPLYWRSLEELAESPEFLARAREEFPGFAAAAEQSYDRRRFLQLTAASMALMGLAACGPEEQPRDREPYIEQPAGLVPGRPRYYATATTHDGYGTGVLIEHLMGRPLKVEGNPEHPASLGATSAIGQASILGLYDPFRAQSLTQDGGIASWDAFATAVIERRTSLRAQHGRGLALLTGTVTSPTLIDQIGRLRHQYPALRWFQWEALHRDQVRAGTEQAFGRPLEVLPDFAAADLIVAIDGDFLDTAPGAVRFAREFASRRRAAEVKDRMSRLYALESTPTLAGAKADHRLLLRPVEIDAALRRLAGALGAAPEAWAQTPAPNAAALDAIAEDLRRARGRAIVHAGAAQSAATHALVHAINHTLGAFGTTLAAIEPVHAEPQDQAASIAALTEAMQQGEIDTLLVMAWNPVFTAPADLEFERALRTVPFSIYLGEYSDETAAAVHWHVARTHEYETWGDVRAYDGTVTIQQPQIRLGADRHSAHELLELFIGETTRPDALTIVRGYWQGPAGMNVGQDPLWTQTLRAGVVQGSAAPHVAVTLKSDAALGAGAPQSVDAVAASAVSLLFRPDPFLWDGRFADNGWMQELGRPFTRLTWDNAALIGPRTAEQLGLATSDIVEITLGARKLRAPVWVLPGQAERCVTLPLGFGRRLTGPVGAGVGVDPYVLRTRDSPWQASGAALRKAGDSYLFATIQRDLRTHDRDLVHEGTLAEFLKSPDFQRHPPPPESLYGGYEYVGIAWAMSINLDACIGCQACVAACQAENNSPVIGKTEVGRGREMHWLRIDRYYEGSLDEPRTVFQPVPCMHCEDAPCEVVCPVHATVHDSEGLNVMVYNRCVGTRFCSNNCPYKVRHFNFYDYTAPDPRPPESWNPEVTVRGRGVMEKCTYCIQRTRSAMIDADRENRRVRDGEVVTACQQACPTEAIVFGDRNDPQSAVAKRKASPLDYAMLADLNTRPRTTYEALIRNPNPSFQDEQRRSRSSPSEASHDPTALQDQQRPSRSSPPEASHDPTAFQDEQRPSRSSPSEASHSRNSNG